MASNNLNLGDGTGSSPSPSAFDNLMLQALMSRLQLRPPYLDTNSFLSESLDEFLTNGSGSESEPDPDDADPAGDGDARHRRQVAREEAKLEKELIRIINAGEGEAALKPNSGNSVSIGDHNICVGVHDEPGSEYRVWEWHGHVMFFDEDDGYSAEYIYGNHFERVGDKKQQRKKNGSENSSKVKGEGNSGLRDLIGGVGGGLAGAAGASRVVHRNALNNAGAASGSSEAK